MDIKVTEAAKVKLYDMGVSEDTFLRIGVKSGGCSGNTYDAVLDDKITDVDEIYYTDDKLRVVSDKVSSVFLDGLSIDFSNDLIEPGFRLTNSNAKGSCGCGSSFSTGDPAPNVDVSFTV
ncbi:MAG: iron-sulfur cluster assembly accessory protein [Candidatus Poseidoniia archaeon]|jgi:iron-sulfur cluster assembly protein|nr:iron-sulfur cluster assembly accessory protein [Candidatus Poseidoniia archaeon]|tara:strand:+ start:8648 stop:9007 length:360 start_codon:yes stop_codon:yes gene_type:complete